MRDEVEKIVIAAEEQDPTWGLFVYLTATLGTRCGETVALRAEDFDERRQFVRVDRAVSKTSGGPTIKSPKSGEGRDLPIEDAAFWDHVRPFVDRPGFLPLRRCPADTIRLPGRGEGSFDRDKAES